MSGIAIWDWGRDNILTYLRAMSGIALHPIFAPDGRRRGLSFHLHVRDVSARDVLVICSSHD